MTQIDSIKILTAIGKVQEHEEIFKANSNYHILRIDAGADANRVMQLDDYHAANRVAQLLNEAYNAGKRVALQELAAEITTTPKNWLEKQ